MSDQEFLETLISIAIPIIAVIWGSAWWLRRRGYGPQMLAFADELERLLYRYVAYNAGLLLCSMNRAMPRPPTPDEWVRARDEWRRNNPDQNPWNKQWR